jgi:hypothetical protein
MFQNDDNLVRTYQHSTIFGIPILYLPVIRTVQIKLGVSKVVDRKSNIEHQCTLLKVLTNFSSTQKFEYMK